MLIDHLYVFFGIISILFFCPFFGLLFYITQYELFIYLEINPLSFTWLVNIFSHSIGDLFILLKVSFAVQKLLSFIRSHIFIFTFASISLGEDSKKYCYYLCQIMFCLCLLIGVL